MIVFVFVFVLCNSFCINLDYEWNSLLKKILFIFFLKHIKIDWFFYCQKPFFFVTTKQIWSFTNWKTIFFLVLKNRSNTFSNQKTLFYVINTDMNFYLQKPFFLNTTKQFWHFYKSKPIFLPIKTDLILFKRRDFIDK